MFATFKNILKKVLPKDYKYKLHRLPAKLEKLGSEYGGWIIPVDYINIESVCYLAGAGEDISFDVAVAARFGCSVLIFDPTPRSKQHFEQVKKSALRGHPVAINNKPGTFYEITPETADHLQFEAIGIWKKKEVVKFYSPKDETHISHSISNLQHTDKYFEATVERLSSIMNRNNHGALDLLKLDIEGAEFDVIDSIVEDEIPIKILCIEFHPNEGKNRVQAAITKLENYGFAVVAREGLDFTFLNRSFIKKK